ncbi:PTS sugar transporter subunit IIC, partial [Streptococcus suis]
VLVETRVTTIELPEYKWIAAGLSLAARMLPGLGFAILIHYLPLKRNLHYLAVGFSLTAMLNVLYGNLSSLGGAVAGIVCT